MRPMRAATVPLSDNTLIIEASRMSKERLVHCAPAPLAVAMLLCAVVLCGCGGAEARRDRYFEKARSLVAQQEWEKAQLELRNALQIDPNDARARVLLGNVAEKLGDPRQAVQIYQSVLDTDKDNAGARAGLAKLYALGGLPDKAIELANAGLAKSPGDADLLTVRGVALARKGDLAAALADAEKAIRSDPKNENAIALLASLYARNNRTDEAMRLVQSGVVAHPKNPDLRTILAQLQESAGKRPEAEQSYRDLIAVDPQNLGHRYLLVQFLLRGDEIDKAETALRAAVKAKPDELQPKLALANLLASKRSFATGEKELLSLVASAPKDLELQLGLAEFYDSHGKTAQSQAAYRGVIDKDGRGAQGLIARNRLAASALRSRDFAGASKLLAEVLEENPQDNDALAMRAEIALDRGDAAAAITDLRAVLRDRPDSIPAQRALARAYLQNKDAALAEQTLRAALERAPGDPQLRVDQAQLLLQSGKTEQAQQALEQVVAQSPTNMAAQELLFRVQASRKDLVGARKTAQLVKSARPELAVGDYFVGLVDRAENKPDEARESFERALRLQPAAAEPLTALVELLVSEKRTDVALARLDTVVAAQPKNAVPANLRGELLVSLNRIPEAAASFRLAIAVAPGWWVPYRGQALAHLLVKETSQAIQVYQEGIKATAAPALETDLATLYERLGRPDDAIRVYEEFARRSPDSEIAANNLAMLLVNYRKDPQSIARARELSARFEKSQVPAYVNTVGWVQYKLGNFAAAIPLLQRAADQAPEAPQMKYMLGMAQYKAGKRDDALRNLEASVQAGRNFTGIDDARAAIAELKRS
jgi:tetratricopeptide (TPR) repeat protein